MSALLRIERAYPYKTVNSGFATKSSECKRPNDTKRDRSDASETSNPSLGRNNTGAVGGYDAYFGTYSVDEETGDVLHCLEGALTAENVGMEVSRTLTVNDDSLVIQLETTTIEGEPVVRTLTWERVA